MHVDDFIDDHKSDPYAAWMFLHFRLPAFQQARFNKFIENRKLFCTYNGERYRVTGASRLGDVWLTKDFKCPEAGYDIRPNVDECFDWGDKP